MDNILLLTIYEEGRNGESVDHLFLLCPVAMDMWAMVFGLFGVSWVMPQYVVGLLACWQGSFGRH